VTESLAPEQPQGLRQRVLDAAYDLFTRRGIGAVETTEVGERAGVDAATVQDLFESKDELALAVLAQRERLWTYGFVAVEAQRRGFTPETRLLAVFDAFDEWFRRDDFEACTFINALLELGSDEPAGRASIVHLQNIRNVLRELAEEAGLRDVDDFVRSFHILMKGSIVAAAEGDTDAAKRAQAMAQGLIERHRAP